MSQRVFVKSRRHLVTDVVYEVEAIQRRNPGVREFVEATSRVGVRWPPLDEYFWRNIDTTERREISITADTPWAQETVDLVVDSFAGMPEGWTLELIVDVQRGLRVIPTRVDTSEQATAVLKQV